MTESLNLLSPRSLLSMAVRARFRSLASFLDSLAAQTATGLVPSLMIFPRVTWRHKRNQAFRKQGNNSWMLLVEQMKAHNDSPDKQ